MSPKKRNQRLLGYTRVSRMREDGISPDLQRKAIEAYVSAHGHEVVWLEPDLDESGKSLDRPSMQKALGLLAEGKADGIIAARLDRLTRKVGDLGRLLELAETQDWNLVAIDLGVDLTTSNGKMVANILGTLAEWELDRRREGWKESRSNAVARGIHISPYPPAGYDRDENGKLIPNGGADQVRAVFLARARGASLRQCALMMEGVKTAGGREGKWSIRATRLLLGNRVYLGEARSGEYVTADAHEALVSAGTFARVEALMSRRSEPRERKPPHPLSGLVRCATCGGAMKRDSTRRNGKVYWFWRCCNSKDVCEAGATIGLPILDQYMEGFYLDRLMSADPHIVLRPLNPPTDDTELEARLLEAQNELAAYVSTVSVADGAEVFRAGLETRQEAVESAREAFAAAVPQTPVQPFEIPAELSNEMRWVDSGLEVSGETVPEAWRQLPDALKHHVYHRVFESITVTPGRAAVSDRVQVVQNAPVT